jgi:hypothetical protein
MQRPPLLANDRNRMSSRQENRGLALTSFYDNTLMFCQIHHILAPESLVGKPSGRIEFFPTALVTAAA